MLSHVAGFITGLNECETGACVLISLALNAPWKFTYHARDTRKSNWTIETHHPDMSRYNYQFIHFLSSRCLLNKEICEELRDGNCLETKQGQLCKTTGLTNCQHHGWPLECALPALRVVRSEESLDLTGSRWTPQALGFISYRYHMNHKIFKDMYTVYV